MRNGWNFNLKHLETLGDKWEIFYLGMGEKSVGAGCIAEISFMDIYA